MRIPRIYTSQTLQADTSLTLEEGPSAHLARVLRMGVGDALILFDGTGGEYRANIAALERRQVRVDIGPRRDIEVESQLRIHLGVAVSRSERMDWVVQKATELGVSELSPLYTERTALKLAGERGERKLRHWQQVAISACEQCGRNRLPTVHPIQTLDSWLAGTSAQRKFVLHPRAHSPLATDLAPHSVALLVGPEGGLSETEIEAAERAGYCTLRLGPRVLRTETAPLAAIAVLQALWGDMGPGQ